MSYEKQRCPQCNAEEKHWRRIGIFDGIGDSEGHHLQDLSTEQSKKPTDCHVMLGRASLSVGADLIAKERCRQIEGEGWTNQHDDGYHGQEMLDAAAAYIRAATRCENEMSYRNAEPPACWPWLRAWWKPSLDPQRNSIKAGALIAAEIDRLHRVNAKAPADNMRGERPFPATER